MSASDSSQKEVKHVPLKKKILKSIGKGVGKGIVYYIGYIVMSYIISQYLIPAVLAAYAPDIKPEEIAGEYTSFTILDYGALAFFIVIGVIGQLCKDLIPYGFIIESLLGLAVLYYILATILGFGALDMYIEDMDVSVHMDMTVFIWRAFQVFIILTLAGILSGIAKEYKERHSKATK